MEGASLVARIQPGSLQSNARNGLRSMRRRQLSHNDVFVLLQKCQKLFAILWPALRVSQRINLQRRLAQPHRGEKVAEQQQDFSVDKRITAP